MIIQVLILRKVYFIAMRSKAGSLRYQKKIKNMIEQIVRKYKFQANSTLTICTPAPMM